MRTFLLSFHSILLPGIVLLAILSPIARLLALPEERSAYFISPTTSTGIILIAPLQRENPATLKIPFSPLQTASRSLFTIFSHTGKKVWERPLDLAASSGEVSGEQIFGSRIPLAAGYYFYQIRNSESLPEISAPFSQFYFNEVSQTHLPGDSLAAAFIEFVDVSGDSFPDIILGINTFTTLEQPQVFINDGSGHFSNQTAARFPPLLLYLNDLAVFDADSDGDLDIYLAADDASGASLNADKLLLNDGQGFFTDVSYTHLPQTPAIYFNADWGFINDDIYPDLLVTSLPGFITPPLQTPLFILLNDGSGHFYEQTSLLPQSSYNAFDAILTDVNGDFLQDIALACLGDLIITDPQGNPIGTLSGRNAIFIRQSNGTFVDETTARMPDLVRRSKLMNVTDINNDGATDLYSINIGFVSSEALNVLYVNDGNGYFSDETALRLPPETVIWNNDAEFADFDHNGFADLFMINVVPGGPAPDFLYFNSGGFFSNESAHLPPIIDFNASSAAADMERDGDADIFISVAPETLTLGAGLPDLLYENVLPPVGIAGKPALHPAPFLLFQNYPNPFGESHSSRSNPSTNLGFRIPHRGGSDFPNGGLHFGFVSLEVFDITGRRVATLLSQELQPGEYRVKWDGRDEAGREVSSGVYIYRLQVFPKGPAASSEKAGSFTQSRKMLLLR